MIKIKIVQLERFFFGCNLKKILQLNSISIYPEHSVFGMRSKQVRRHLHVKNAHSKPQFSIARPQGTTTKAISKSNSAIGLRLSMIEIDLCHIYCDTYFVLRPGRDSSTKKLFHPIDAVVIHELHLYKIH